jgi:hypothetical protein
LVNQGMMLSPWFPPRYLWAAIEGAAGLDLSYDPPRVEPHPAPDWQWMGVQNLPYRGQSLTWLAVRIPEVQVYTNYHFHESSRHAAYEEDITGQVHAVGSTTVVLAFRRAENLLLFVGSTDEHTLVTALRVEIDLEGSYRLRIYDSLVARWVDRGAVPAEQLRRGIVLQIERKGFWLLEVAQET